MRTRVTWGLLLLFALAGRGAAFTAANRGGLALQTGIWKPSVIDREPSQPFTPVDGAGMCWGGSLFSPQLGGFTLRLSGWQWQQKDVAAAVTLDKVVLRHLALDLKYQLLGGVAIRPYVAYGGALVFAREEAASVPAPNAGFAHLGYALNIGAGVDFLLLRHWGLSAEYQYLYADMDKTVGLTSRYSGPKLTFSILLLY